MQIGQGNMYTPAAATRAWMDVVNRRRRSGKNLLCRGFEDVRGRRKRSFEPVNLVGEEESYLGFS
eukprot:1384134-Amorphochlora_amoeboformis.AAC.1